MRSVCYKLKRLKGVSKELNKKSYSNISIRTNQKREQLIETQTILQKKTFDPEVINKIKELKVEYSELVEVEERFYKDKARVNWLQFGDKNTAYFHRKVRRHTARSRMLSLYDDEGNHVTEYEQAKQVDVKYYKNLFKKAGDLGHKSRNIMKQIVTKAVSEEM